MKRDWSMTIWWSAMSLLIAGLITFGGVMSVNEANAKPETYRVASVVCEETEPTPWDVSICQWKAYEKFYGTDAALAAWEEGQEEVGK